MNEDICPFCGCNPFHYVDNGVAMEAVAVTCCELGIVFFSPTPPGVVEVDWEDFVRVANVFTALRVLGMKP
jgi:hypothetical protein